MAKERYSTRPTSRRYPNSPSQMTKDHLLYCEIAGVISTRPDYHVQRTALDTILVCHITDGKGTLDYQNRQYPLHQGSLFIIDCMEPHYYSSDPQHPMELTYLHMNGSAIRYYYQQITQQRQHLFAVPPNSAAVSSINRITALMKERHADNDLVCNIHIHTFLTELIRLSQDTSTSASTQSSKQLLTEDIQAYIANHLSSDLTVSDIAHEFGVSQSHLLRLFKAHANHSLYDYILKMRLNTFKHLLLNTDQSISECLYAAGFKDHSNLSRYFKKHEGITPKEYRQNYK